MNNTTANPEPAMLFAIHEAADILGIGRTNVYALLKTGKLQSVRIGGRRLIPRTALEQFVADLEKA